jgi:capsular polysaccharide transport system permease protein
MTTVRTSLEVTFSVWKALFLREAITRLSRRRAAWLWLLLEPVVHIVFIMLIMTVLRMRKVGGMDTAVWIMVGLLAFFSFKRVAMQAMNAVGSNEALFNYRQVKPVDTVLVRAALEGLLMVLVAVLLFLGAALLGLAVVPADPLLVLGAFFGMWLLGLGFGLITSVAVELVPELGDIIGMAMTPFYFASGVIIPFAGIPYPYRDWLLLNPLPHGVEAGRLGFSSSYQAFPGLSLAYVYGFAVALIFLGLVLHIRFAKRLVMQ